MKTNNIKFELNEDNNLEIPVEQLPIINKLHKKFKN